MNCLECQSVNISGNETCDEMKAMNNLLEGPLLEGQSTGENSTVNNSSSINWHDSYCEDYSKCIKSNCPRQCFHEQALFMDCVIIELDCDLGCSSDWMPDEMIGDRIIGRNSSPAPLTRGILIDKGIWVLAVFWVM